MKHQPTAEEVVKARKDAGLTQSECAELIHINLRSWAKYEGDERKMHPAYWELFLLKSGQLALDIAK